MTEPQLELPSTPDGHIAVIRCRASDGTILWEAFPPEREHDAWMRIEVAGDEVLATSWSCWHVRLHRITGAEVSRTFTK